MNIAQLITCPICSPKRILGSIDINGVFYVKRFGASGGTTVIISNEFMIICSCGFGTTINNDGVTNYPIAQENN